MKSALIPVVLLLSIPVLAKDNSFPGSTNSDTSVLLVRHRANASERDIDDFHDHQGGARKFKHLRWSAVKLPPGQEKRIRDNYENSQLFDRVEFNQLWRPTIIPNDPLYPSQWGMNKIAAPMAWDKTTSNNIIVAIVDTGIDYNHPELRTNLFVGPQGEHGYSVVAGVVTAGGLDGHGHGTHVAGIIGAHGNNGVGVAGINWRVKLLSGQFIGPTGFGSTEDAVLIMEKIVDLKLAGYNIRVANHSWGGGGPSQAMEDAFLLMQQANIINVCAAGNNGQDSDIDPFYPASLPNDSIISVLASDANDDKASFSNWGDVTTDIFAPGTVVPSTWIGGGYLTLNGTSMAAPHVSGVCAALFGINPAMSYKQCKDVMLYPATLDHVPFTHNSTFGGRLNMEKSVNSPLIFAAPNNNSPVLTIVGTNLVDIPPGQAGTMRATATDRDGDALHYSYSLRSKYGYDYWLISEAIGPLLHSESGETNQVTIFNENHIAVDLDFEALFAVTDGRGGADLKKGDFFLRRDDSLVKPSPTITISLRNDSSMAYPILRVDSPELGYGWFSYSSLRNGWADGNTCCFPINSETPVYGGLVPGPNVFRAQVMDRFGNLASSPQLVVDVGNTGKFVPECKVKVNATRGPLPFTVTADMTESDPYNAHHLQYYASAWRKGGDGIDVTNPVRTFTLDRLGINPIEFRVYDPTNQTTDVFVMMFTVLPPVAVATNPPVSLLAPQNLSAKASGTTITLTWVDKSTGEDTYVIDYTFKSGALTGVRHVELKPDTQTYSFSGTKKVSYEFKVRCCKDSSCSPYSNTASIRLK